MLENYELVKKIESYGSQSGKTSKKIVIADSGELIDDSDNNTTESTGSSSSSDEL